MARKRSVAPKADPFSKEKLREVFRTDPSDPGRLIARESGTLELKRNFGLRSLPAYARTLAAFANTNGGYIVFGIGNQPRTLLGMASDQFDQLDPERLTDFLNEKFSPEISWSAHVHRIAGERFGLIYVHEAREKPVIAKADAGDDIKNGQIYYRYRGRTEAIRYPELRRIIDEQRRKEQELWLRHLRSIADAGVRQAAILDPILGTITGTGGTLVIDKQVLPKLKFLREGEFREKEGAPAIRLLGDAQILAAGKVEPIRIEPVPTVIRTPQIIEAFLNGQRVEAPLEFIKAIPYEPSVFLPLYFLVRTSGLSLMQVVEVIEESPAPPQSVERLCERLETGDPKLSHSIPPTDMPAAAKKRFYRGAILSKSLDPEFPDSDTRYVLQAVRTLEASEIDSEYVFGLLRTIYARLWGGSATLRTEIRLAICHVDYVLYGPR